MAAVTSSFSKKVERNLFELFQLKSKAEPGLKGRSNLLLKLDGEEYIQINEYDIDGAKTFYLSWAMSVVKAQDYLPLVVETIELDVDDEDVPKVKPPSIRWTVQKDHIAIAKDELCRLVKSNKSWKRFSDASLWHLVIGETKTVTLTWILRVVAAFLRRSLSVQHDDFAGEVERAMMDCSIERRKRLSIASPKPRTTTVASQIYLRNPDVVAEVLLRANGRCERCNSLAPFFRRTNRHPYLEVHHRKQLSMGGDDTVENAIGLCPNCHREVHFGMEMAN